MPIVKARPSCILGKIRKFEIGMTNQKLWLIFNYNGVGLYGNNMIIGLLCSNVCTTIQVEPLGLISPGNVGIALLDDNLLD